MGVTMTKEEIIESLGLELHPSEGGYFRRTYESGLTIKGVNSNRTLLTSIYYMLTSDSPTGYLHRNKSDIIHFYHLGSAIKYLIITLDGEVREKTLGPDIANGEVLQLVVNGGEWKASRLCSGGFSLISEAVSPGFEYDDNEIANLEDLIQLSPDFVPRFEKYIKREKI
jgi:predicted cupin superfamily sugar epimerase